MAMRTECKNYESRTYANGEVVRKCRVDLAPEAPWRCPADCAGFERRMFDAGWQVGSLSEGYGRPEPEPEAQDVAALLDGAVDVAMSVDAAWHKIPSHPVEVPSHPPAPSPPLGKRG